MLKRVNIQYSIDLDDLPEEIGRIYANAKSILDGICLPDTSGEDILTADVLKKLDETRRQLTYLDHALSDVSSIVGAYVEYELSTLTGDQTNISETEQDAENFAEMSE